jgi:competence protein ComEC
MKKYFIILSILLFMLGCILIYQNITYNDKKLHVVICDVGQGDGIFVRTPRGIDIVMDGGPDNRIIDCIGKRMPFWDKTIEIVILSHPHADHLTGLITLSKYYKIETFVTENLKNNTVGYQALLQSLISRKIKINYVYAGDKFKIRDGVSLEVVGPSKEFLQETSPNGEIGDTGELASLESLLTYGKFSMLLTGDSQTLELGEALKSINSSISVLQVPHHGSKFGLNQEILGILNPKFAVISVGKDNKYSHPNSLTLDLLKQSGSKTLRTDQIGDIEIISDGNGFSTKN